jgi:hypothetical protein
LESFLESFLESILNSILPIYSNTKQTQKRSNELKIVGEFVKHQGKFMTYISCETKHKRFCSFDKRVIQCLDQSMMKTVPL